MQFRDLGMQYLSLKHEIDTGIEEVLRQCAFINGPHVKQLEAELAAYVGRKHCIACASGTDALILPLMAWGIGPDDAVFVPDFTYFASVNCAMLRGATPVLVDIDERTFNMSPGALEQAIERTISQGKLNPRVVIPVDLFGQPAELVEISRIAKRYGLLVLEDAAQGFGGSIGGKPTCSFGDVAATSFFPAKPLGCYGDGGAMFTDDEGTATRLRSMRMQGSSPLDKYDNISIGLNSRLDSIQAAILLPKLHAFIDHELDDANHIAQRYSEALEDVVKVPFIMKGYRSSWAQYTILLETPRQRDGLRDHLKSQGIPSMVYYPRGMHQQSAILNGGYADGAFPITESVAQRCLSLPMGPYLNKEDQDRVIQSIREYMRQVYDQN